jgi:hypothetical protein
MASAYPSRFPPVLRTSPLTLLKSSYLFLSLTVLLQKLSPSTHEKVPRKLQRTETCLYWLHAVLKWVSPMNRNMVINASTFPVHTFGRIAIRKLIGIRHQSIIQSCLSLFLWSIAAAETKWSTCSNGKHESVHVLSYVFKNLTASANMATLMCKRRMN